MGTRSFVAASELALSLVLLVATGLTLKSLFQVVRTDLGFRPAGVLTGSLSLPTNGYPSPGLREQFIADVVAKVAALPV